MKMPSIQESARYALLITAEQKSWRDKIVTNPKTGNKVKVSSLPPKEQEKYKPKKTKTQEPTSKSKSVSPNKLIETKHNVKIGKNSVVNFNDGKTPKTHPQFFAKAGNTYHRLTRPIPKGEGPTLKYGKPEFNPKWAKDPDNQWYAKVPKILKPKHKNYSQYAKEGKTAYEYVYTTSGMVKNGRTKFLGIQKVAEHWEDIRKQNAEHRKSNPVGSKTFAAACIFGVQLETAARIGTKGNESRGVFGAHSLQRKHMTFNKNGTLELNYIDKGQVPQHKIIVNKSLIEDIKKLYDRTKKPTDSVFTWSKADNPNRLVDPDDINGREDAQGNITRKGYLQSFGIPMTSHHVRHVWASKIFTAESAALNRKSIKPEFQNGIPSKAYIKNVNNAFMNCVEKVANQLGNKPKASLDNYIDPTLIVGFWNGFGITSDHYPKTLQTRMAKASDNSPLPETWMFEGAHADNFFDFNIFLGNIDFTNEPPVPKSMADNDLQSWI